MKKTIKRIFVAIALILLVLIGIIVFTAIKELKEEDILKQEIVNYNNKDLLEDDYKIEVKTTGDRAYVEEAVKKYYKSLSDNVKDINYYLNDQELINILTIDNLIKDNPNFINSHNLIKKTKTNVTKAFNNISRLCEEETIKNLIDKDKLSDSDYYYDFYLDLMYTEKDIEKLNDTKEEMEKVSKNLNLFLDKVDEILTFLEINSNSIEYTNENILFQTDELVNEYNNLLNELSLLATNLENLENEV